MKTEKHHTDQVETKTSHILIFYRYMNNIERAKDPSQAPKFKYLRWPSADNNGWGNRFSFIVTGVIFGLMTDRLVFIEPWKESTSIKSRYNLLWKDQEEYVHHIILFILRVLFRFYIFTFSNFGC